MSRRLGTIERATPEQLRRARARMSKRLEFVLDRVIVAVETPTANPHQTLHAIRFAMRGGSNEHDARTGLLTPDGVPEYRIDYDTAEALVKTLGDMVRVAIFAEVEGPTE